MHRNRTITLAAVVLMFATLLVPLAAPGQAAAGGSPDFAKDDVYYVQKNTVLDVPGNGVLANDDAGSELHSVEASTLMGSLFLQNGGAFTYTPPVDFVGTDVFTYEAFIGVEVDSATVTIHVVNSLTPVANSRRYYVAANTELIVDAPGVIGTEPQEVPIVSAAVALPPLSGTLDFAADGGFVYVPSQTDALPRLDSFVYTLTNAAGRSNFGGGIVTIITLGPFVLHDDAYATSINTPLVIDAEHGVLANDDGDQFIDPAIGLAIARPASGGDVTLNDDGSFTYTPFDGFTGLDVFSYTALDLVGRFKEGNVTVAVGVALPTATHTMTPKPTATFTKTPVPTATFTTTPAPTATNTSTPTKTSSPTPTKTSTPTKTPSSTPTKTSTPTRTPVPTATKTATVQPGVPSVSLSRTRTTVNTPVQFTISGFTPNQDVTIKWRRLTGSIFDVLTVRTDASGAATGSFRVPATPGGPGQEVRFVQGNITKTVPFEIRARIKITPDPAARGQEIDISLRGYSRTETVRIRWLLNGKFEQIATVQTSNTGSANLKIAVPNFIPDGEHSVRGDGSLFRQQTNVMTVLGGTPFTPQVVAAEEVSPSPTATVTATATVTPIATATAEITPDVTVDPTPVPTAASTPEQGETPEATTVSTVEPPVPVTPGPIVTEELAPTADATEASAAGTDE